MLLEVHFRKTFGFSCRYLDEIGGVLDKYQASTFISRRAFNQDLRSETSFSKEGRINSLRTRTWSSSIRE